jgi:uncharacterized membrane protein YhfC
MESVTPLLLAAEPFHVYLGILERFSATLFHIFATVLVFRAVIERKWHYAALAVAAHTLFNFIAALLMRFTGIVITEAALLVMALAAGYYVISYSRANK